MERFVNDYPWIILILLMGSIVDIFQFIWLLKRSYRRMKRLVYNRIRREILEGKD
jgi:hypothetical protein